MGKASVGRNLQPLGGCHDNGMHRNGFVVYGFNMVVCGVFAAAFVLMLNIWSGDRFMPEYLTFTRVDENTAILQWSPPLTWKGENDDSVTHYILSRSSGDDQYEFIANVSVTSEPLSYIDRSLLPGISYFYSVRAVNRHGVGPPTSVLYLENPAESGILCNSAICMPEKLIVGYSQEYQQSK